jgi:hypothetical protein
MIKKDGELTISLNRMKSTQNVSTKEDCIKFIHKKNPNKGKLNSIKLKGPYKSNTLLKWIIYYESPLNKNHINTEWNLCCPDGTFTVYNGAVLIYTNPTSDSNDEYPIISDTEDIDINSALDWRVSTVNITTQIEDDGEDEEDEEDEGYIVSATSHNLIGDNSDDENVIDDTFDIPKTAIDQKKNGNKIIELKDDLKDKNGNLVYEKYDYECDIIPMNPMMIKSQTCSTECSNFRLSI